MPIWAQLTVGRSDDPVEREAEALAHRAMEAPVAGPVATALPPAPPAPTVRRKAGCPCGTGGGCACAEEEVRRSGGGEEHAGGDAPPQVGRVLQAPGAPLADTVRADMEASFGADFGHVRIHTSGLAAEAAASVGAEAFTARGDVVFGAGRYDPGTRSGRLLLAHELAHTLQADGSTPAIRRQSTPTTGAPTVTAGQQACTSALTATATEADKQLARAVDTLLDYAAARAYPYAPGDPRQPEHVRVAAHLLSLFRTTDALDVQAIAFRLGRLRRALANGEVRMDCSCAASGGGPSSSVVLGRSTSPFTFSLCSVTAPAATLAPVMIHECAHAVLPDIGMTGRPTGAIGTGVLDRAYDQERLFTRMSTIEAMTNADSYSELVIRLNGGGGVPAAAGSTDRFRSCPDSEAVETALGRAQQAARLVSNWLGAAARLLQGSGSTAVSSMADPSIPVFTGVFPRITTLAQLQSVANDATVVYTNFMNSTGIACNPPPASCPADRLVFAGEFQASASSVSRMGSTLDQTGFINLCPAWTSASESHRIHSLFSIVAAAYLGGAMVQILVPTDAGNLATFALHVVSRHMPPPRARSATAHLGQ